MLLTLKAVQWLEPEGDQQPQRAPGRDHVVLVNLGRTTATQPQARAMQEAINERRAVTATATATGSRGHLLRVVYPLDKIPVENVAHEAAASADSVMSRVREARGVVITRVGGARGRGGAGAGGPRRREATGGGAEGARRRKEGVTGEGGGQEKGGGVRGPGLRIRAGMEDRLHFVVSNVDPKDEKTRRLLLALPGLPSVHSVWWSTCEPLRTQGTCWSRYKVEELKHVTRRPPSVQHVLKTLEWRDEWKDSYASESVESGLPTEGPPVVYVQHQEHLREIRRAYNIFKNSTEQRRQHPSAQPHSQIPQQVRHSADNDGWHPTRDHAELVHPQQDRQELDENQNLLTQHHHQRVSHERGSTLNSDGTFRQEHGQDTRRRDINNPIFRRCEMQSASTSREEVEVESAVGMESDSLDTVLRLGEGCSGQLHSPFWCDLCAETVADTISHLITDSANPNLSPFYVGRTKMLKDPSKLKFGMPIKPRDIVILTTFPPQQQNGGRKSSQEEINNRFKDLTHSTLALRIRDEVSLKVLAEDSGGKIAFPRNSVILTDVSTARGIERKVVIYVPWGVPQRATLTIPRAALGEGTTLYSASGSNLGPRPQYSLPLWGRMDTSENVSWDTGNNVPRVTSCNPGGYLSQDRSLETLFRLKFNGSEPTSPDEWPERRSLDSFVEVCGVGASDIDEDGAAIVETSSSDTMDMWGSSSLETKAQSTFHDFSMDYTAAPREQDLAPRPYPPRPTLEHDRENSAEEGEGIAGNSRSATSRDCRTPEEQQEQDSALVASTTSEQLPRWVKEKRGAGRAKSAKSKILARLLERYTRQRVYPADLQEPGPAEDCALGERQEAENSVACHHDHLLSGLGDDNARGLYAAAACCMALLVVVMP